MMLLLYGFALSLDVDHIPMLIYDQDGTSASRDLARDFQGSRYFDVKGMATRLPRAGEGHRPQRHPDGHGDPARFRQGPGGRPEATVQLLVDGSDSNTAAIAMGYAESMVQGYSAAVRAEMLNRKGVTSSAAAGGGADARLVQQLARIEELRGAGADRGDPHDSHRPIDHADDRARMGDGDHGADPLDAAAARGNGDRQDAGLFPGGAGGRDAGLRFGRDGVRGAVPRQPAGAGAFHAGVSVRGHVLGNLHFGRLPDAGGGIPDGHAEHVPAGIPAFGFVFSIDTMPKWIQVISIIVPSRYFVTILKALFLKGVGLEIIWPQIVYLLLFTGIVYCGR